MGSVLVFARRHTTFVFGIAIVAALSGILLVARVSFDANILRLLPQRSPSVRDFQLFLRNFGSLDHLYIVFESADAIGDHSDLVDAYVEELRKAPEIAALSSTGIRPSLPSVLPVKAQRPVSLRSSETGRSRFGPWSRLCVL